MTPACQNIYATIVRQRAHSSSTTTRGVTTDTAESTAWLQRRHDTAAEYVRVLRRCSRSRLAKTSPRYMIDHTHPTAACQGLFSLSLLFFSPCRRRPSRAVCNPTAKTLGPSLQPLPPSSPSWPKPQPCYITMLTKERLGSGEHLPHDEAEAVNIPLLVVLLVVRNLAVMKVRRRNRRGGGIRRFSTRACKR